MIWAHHSEGPFYRGLQDFIATRIFGDTRWMGEGTILAATRGDRVTGAVVFHNWQFGVIEVSGAGDGQWLTRGFLQEAASFAFGQLQCHAVMFRSDKARVDRIAKALGFQRTDIPHGRGLGKPESVYVLTLADWQAGKFCKESAHEQRTETDTAA